MSGTRERDAGRTPRAGDRVRETASSGELISSRLIERIAARTARVGVVGLGYVGLPVALAFVEAGFPVIGVDIDAEKVLALKQGRSYLRDIPAPSIRQAVGAGTFRPTTSYAQLRRADAVVVCMPTPLDGARPDTRHVEDAARRLAKVLQPGSLAVLESTVYPGATESLFVPLLESSGLRVGRDLLVAYSPERIDPGRRDLSFREIPKVVGGIGGSAARAAEALYATVVDKVVVVSGPREAEMAKLIENSFRHVNIALVHELAMYADDLEVDIWEALGAAATKPYGYLPFWPGPGWGGHCIPLDPAYLSWRVRDRRGHGVRFIDVADAVAAEVPRVVVERAQAVLNVRGKALARSRVLGIGMAFKAGVEDIRRSPGSTVLAELARRGAEVSYHDPLVPRVTVGEREMRSVRLSAARLKAADLVIVFIPQVNVDWETVARHAPLVLDCCNALTGIPAAGQVERLWAPSVDGHRSRRAGSRDRLKGAAQP